MGKQFSSDYQPSKRKKRGRQERTKILEALKESGRTEDDFYRSLVDAANDPKSPIHQFAIKEVKEGLQPKTKPTMPLIDIELDRTLKPYEQCEQINTAAAEGLISVDVATQFVTNITNTMKVKEISDLEERIKLLEDNQ